MAARLAGGFKSVAGATVLHPVQANELFVVLPEATVIALERQHFKFYRWPLHAAESGVAIRLVTSYATLSAEVDEFIVAAAAA
jgi:threonine aldolase